MQKIKESDIQAQCKALLQYAGWFVYKNHQSLGSYRGVADLTAIKNGQVIWVEIKTPKGKLSEYQQRFKSDIEKHGGVYIVARCPEDLEEIAFTGVKE